MGRRVAITVFCDNTSALWHGEDESPGEPVAVSIGARVSYLDLCEGCQANLVVPLQNLALEYGTVTPSNAPTPTVRPIEQRGGRKPAKMVRDMPCLLCRRPYASGSGLTNHYHDVHRIQSQFCTYKALYGTTCPLCNQEFNALGGHTQREHGGLLTVQAFDKAEKEGDTYGVVKRAHENIQRLAEEGVIAEARGGTSQ